VFGWLWILQKLSWAVTLEKNYREKYAVEKAVDSGQVFLTNEQTPHVIDDTFLLLSRRRG
jgi:hypothetical protein